MRPDRRPVRQTETAGNRRAGSPPGQRPEESGSGHNVTKAGLTFKGSEIDRKFSYAGLSKMIREQLEKRVAEMAEGEIKYMLKRRREQADPIIPEPREGRKAATAADQAGGDASPASSYTTLGAKTISPGQIATVHSAVYRNRRHALYAGTMVAAAAEPDAAGDRPQPRGQYAASILVRQDRNPAIYPCCPAPQGRTVYPRVGNGDQGTPTDHAGAETTLFRAGVDKGIPQAGRDGVSLPVRGRNQTRTERCADRVPCNSRKG